MKMKKIIITFLAAIMVIMPFSALTVNAEETSSDKVKVYVFAADSCGWCKSQLAWFDELSKKNDKFEVIELRAYDANWAAAEYYDLAVEVADYFTKEGFQNATIDSTPFVVISDVYASATYSEDFESIINEVYEKGDVDIVGQIAASMGSNFETNEVADNDNDSGEKIFGILVVVTLVAVIGVSIHSRIKSKSDYGDDERDYSKGKEKQKQNNDKVTKTNEYLVACKECGHENPSGSGFCNNCGSSLKIQTETKSANKKVQKNSQNGRAGRPKKR